MEQIEIPGARADSDVCIYVANQESGHVRTGGGVLVCGGSGLLRDLVSTYLATIAGGALVGELLVVQAERALQAREAGLGTVLYTALDPDQVVDLMASDEMLERGWSNTTNDVTFGDVVDRYVHITYSPAGNKFIVTRGALAHR